MEIIEELRAMLIKFYSDTDVRDVLKRLELEMHGQVMLKNGMVVSKKELESFTNVWE